MATPRAIIVGAGIAGLSAGIALRDAGWQVEIFDQAPALMPMGAALSIWPNAVEALEHLGCREALHERAAPLQQLALMTSYGGTIMRNTVNAILPGTMAYLPTRTALQSILLERAAGIPFHLDRHLLNFEEHADAAIVRFRNGVEAEADLVVAADGIRSRIAHQLTGVEPKHAGYGGVLALSGRVCGKAIDGIGTEYWSKGERFGLFDLGEDRRYWFYMRNEADSSESARVTLDQVCRQTQEWPEGIQEALNVTSADALIPFSIHAKPPPKCIAAGRIVLVGDAGHAMEPNLGQGACQALEDAVALGAAAHKRSAKDAAALYQRMRLKRARQFVALSEQGGLVPHRLPSPLAALAMTIMPPIFQMMAPRQMRGLFTMPNYRAIAD